MMPYCQKSQDNTQVACPIGWVSFFAEALYFIDEEVVF